MTHVDIDKDLKAEIEVAAYFLSQRNYSYNDLCWMLADKQFFIEKGQENYKKDEVRERAEEIFQQFYNYDNLCFLNAELEVIISRKLY